MKTIYLAGGCFWGVQKYLDQFPGVIATETGYANGPDERDEKRYLGKLTEEQKLERGAKAAGVTVEEWEGLSASDRTLLRVASRKENIYAHGFSKAVWKRLPMVEKFAILKEKK